MAAQSNNLNKLCVEPKFLNMVLSQHTYKYFKTNKYNEYINKNNISSHFSCLNLNCCRLVSKMANEQMRASAFDNTVDIVSLSENLSMNRVKLISVICY